MLLFFSGAARVSWSRIMSCYLVDDGIEAVRAKWPAGSNLFLKREGQLSVCGEKILPIVHI